MLTNIFQQYLWLVARELTPQWRFLEKISAPAPWQTCHHQASMCKGENKGILTIKNFVLYYYPSPYLCMGGVRPQDAHPDRGDCVWRGVGGGLLLHHHHEFSRGV